MSDPFADRARIPLPRLLTVVMSALLLAGGALFWLSWQEQQRLAEEEQTLNAISSPNAPLTERIQSVERWVAMGEAGVPHLVELLSGPDVKARELAAFGLGRIGRTAQSAGPALIACLRDENASVREAALWSLTSLGYPLDGECSLIAGFLSEGNSRIAMEAGQALVVIGPPAIPAVGEAAVSPEPGVRILAITVLAHIGSDGAAGLHIVRNSLHDEDPAVRLLALKILITWNELTAEEALAALRDPDQRIAETAASVLGNFGPEVDGIIPALVEMLKKDETRRVGLAGLGSLGPRASSAAPEAMTILEDSSYYLELLLPFVARIATQSEELVPRILPYLVEKSPYTEVSLKAGALLRQVSPEAGRAAVPGLIEHLASEDDKTRSCAAAALAGLGPDAQAAIPDLTNSLADPYVWTRIYAVKALGEIGPPANSAVPELIELVDLSQPGAAERSAEPLVRRNAVEALIRLGKGREDAESALLRAAADPDSEVRRKALFGIVELGVDPSVGGPFLIAALTHEEERTRPIAPLLLSRMRLDSQTAVPLLTAATRDPNPHVRMNAVEALAAYGPAAKPAVPALLSLMQREHSSAVRLPAEKQFDLMNRPFPWTSDPPPPEPRQVIAAALQAIDPENDYGEPATED